MLSFLKPKPAPVGCCCGGKISALSSLLSPVPDVLLPRKLALVSPAQPSEAAPTKPLFSLHAFPPRCRGFGWRTVSSSSPKVERPAVKQPVVAS